MIIKDDTCQVSPHDPHPVFQLHQLHLFYFIFSICYSKHVFVYTFFFLLWYHSYTHITLLYIKICIKGTNTLFFLFLWKYNIIIMSRYIVIHKRYRATLYMPLCSFNFVEFRVWYLCMICKKRGEKMTN